MSVEFHGVIATARLCYARLTHIEGCKAINLRDPCWSREMASGNLQFIPSVVAAACAASPKRPTLQLRESSNAPRMRAQRPAHRWPWLAESRVGRRGTAAISQPAGANRCAVPARRHSRLSLQVAD